MNTAQIAGALTHNAVTSTKFCGVFPSDKIPRTIHRYPCGFVVNTDPSTKPGTHWVAFYFPSEEKAEFFDSYGHTPKYYKLSLGNLATKYIWTFNHRTLQSAWTAVCGHYCIFYLAHRANGYSMNKIINLFDHDSMSNDVHVERFVKAHFNLSAHSTVRYPQCCTPILK